MNIFVLLRKPGGGGDLELVTPSLDNGIILPGVTRRSVVELTREWNEFEVNERKITMKEVSRPEREIRTRWVSLILICLVNNRSGFRSHPTPRS